MFPEGIFLCRPLLKREQLCDIPPSFVDRLVEAVIQSASALNVHSLRVDRIVRHGFGVKKMPRTQSLAGTRRFANASCRREAINAGLGLLAKNNVFGVVLEGTIEQCGLSYDENKLSSGRAAVLSPLPLPTRAKTPCI